MLKDKYGDRYEETKAMKVKELYPEAGVKDPYVDRQSRQAPPFEPHFEREDMSPYVPTSPMYSPTSPNYDAETDDGDDEQADPDYTPYDSTLMGR